MFLSQRRSFSKQSLSRRFQDRRLTLEPLEQRVVMTAGMLDTTFGGGDGVALDYISIDTVAGGGIQIDGDKILVAGSVQGASITTGSGRKAVTTTDPADFGIARYNSDGSLDATFGGDGLATAIFSPAADRVYDMAVTPDGKYIVAGESTLTTTVTVGKKTTTTTSLDFAVARFNSDGSLDTSFSGDGMQTIDFGGTEHGFAVVVQSDGQIVVAGQQMGTDSKFVLTRLNVDGSVDASFGANGKVVTNIGEADVLNDVALQTLGDETYIVAVGRVDVLVGTGANYDATLVRYRFDGSLDATFGAGGIVLTSLGGASDAITDVAIGASGEILGSSFVQTNADTDMALLRYTPNGVLAGTTVVQLPNQQLPEGITVQADGKIVVAGRSKAASTGNGTQSIAVRFLASGELDPSFADGGVALWDVNADNSGALVDELSSGVAIDADGQIVISASVSPTGNTDETHWAITRLTADEIVEPVESASDEDLIDLAILALLSDEASET